MQQNVTAHLFDILMQEYASRTGLEPLSEKPHRYLWTDAFAVCNYLGRYRKERDEADLEMALRLIDQVHSVLGQFHPDDPRSGWISGLDKEEGSKRPTAGGLRIGKPLLERGADEPYDPELEWERDGQYYHYLTKWMHALAQAGRVTGEMHFIEMGVDLARAAHSAFVHAPYRGQRKRLYWKMSVDLSRPLVPSMGQHDALDGYLTFVELQAAGEAIRPGARKQLVAEISELALMYRGGNWETDDPLGIGGLLMDASRMAQLMREGAVTDSSMLGNILRAALPGLEMTSSSGLLDRPAERRLAFRELGMAIGLKGVSLIRESLINQAELYGNTANMRLVQELMRYLPMSERIETFWSLQESRRSATWEAHQDISDVMLATCIEPQGFLRF
ncbi:MAG TPA: hypothetical protein PKX52_00085 [Methanomassiliicoccaceae archaeon]|jgi:hypothetical protein|nr:hypothetical protein [Methanomassiliicoccaceae archaeon]HOL06813.1 hypothetical protein [Methanomassiliicoccaceae archaeon]HOQ25749.1 hypothetical protein [Methanomassiliicoccaceae archaeon]HPT73282.1 hypothetical protein [Methanomassiliicoccaceae archaeon]HQA20366.1 hypothetical protein [Methanomassiliicoccaceae archaeon]